MSIGGWTLNNKILVVVDMQNDFIDGVLGTPEAQKIVDKVSEKVDYYRKKHWHIVATVDTHFNNYLDTSEGQHLPVQHCLVNTNGWCVHDSIKDKISYKLTKCKFASDELVFTIMDMLGPSRDGKGYEIEICGLCTDICVIMNTLVLKDHFPEATITVDSQCCAGSTPSRHDAALEVMQSCQIEVV